MESGWREHIVSTPEVLRGKPRIKGTRIPVSLVLGYLAAGKTVQEIIGEFPDLGKEQIGSPHALTMRAISPNMRSRSDEFEASGGSLHLQRDN